MRSTLLIMLSIVFVYSFTVITKDYNIDSEFTLLIKGTSNVHDWESSIEELKGNVKLSHEEGKFNIEKCNVMIPVKSIKSKKGSIMNKKTWKALDEKTYPEITYDMTAFELTKMDEKDFIGKATGDLAVAGNIQAIEMMISGKFLPDNRIEIRGTKDMKMTDFNIDPPTALLGTMKTGDDITIEFQIVLNAE